MDRRGTLVLGLGMWIGGIGCVHTPTLPPSTTPDVPRDKIVKESDQPPHKAKPSTYVAFGAFSEQAAEEPKRSPVEQEQLRDKARRYYQKALEQDPKDIPALTSLARLYTRINDHPRAVATYEQAIAAHPKEAGLYYELGMCRARHQEWEPALVNLRRAVELEPEQRLFNHSLGFALARVGRHDESFAVFAKLEGDASAHYNVARMLHHLKDDVRCREHVQEALRLKPDLVQAQELLASLDGKAPAAPPVDPAGLENASPVGTPTTSTTSQESPSTPLPNPN